jgi:chromate reductase
MSQAVLGKRLFQVIGLAGSLRKESYNRQLMLAAQHMAPKEVCLHIAELREIPLYDGDIELEGISAAVVTLKAHVREADALLIATPEYNGFMPGVLHNVLDWLSRPRATTPLAKKRIFLMGATPGQRGTRSAQEHLRQLLSNI